MASQDTAVWKARLRSLEQRRTARSLVPLEHVRTIDDRTAGFTLAPIGSAWTESAFDGPFYQSLARNGIAASVVFVQSRDGNTGTRNPAGLGGGAVDEHLIYEGLTRVAADAVICGSGTLHPDAFFTVWRPELVALRERYGLPRHPTQVVMSTEGSVGPDSVLLFNIPDVPVYVLTSPAGRHRLSTALTARPWVHTVVAESLPQQFEALRRAGIQRISSVGGRRSASALVDAGLVGDVYLTTTPCDGGEPGTPWYVGAGRLALRPALIKEWDGADGTVRFVHYVTGADGET
jgi:riboflavin biosynthesis pyrimidine reductase